MSESSVVHPDCHKIADSGTLREDYVYSISLSFPFLQCQLADGMMRSSNFNQSWGALRAEIYGKPSTMHSDHRLKTYLSSNIPLPDPLHPCLDQVLEGLDGLESRLIHEEKVLDEGIEQRWFAINALEKEIESLEAVRRRLSKAKNDAQVRRSRYTIIYAPIRRIPPEIVARILMWATSRYNIDCSPLSSRGLAYFSGLRRVCRLWRSTVFSTPGLWRNLALHLDVLAGPGYPPIFVSHTKIQSVLTSWFSRAGDGPLELIVNAAVNKNVTDVLSVISTMNTGSVKRLAFHPEGPTHTCFTRDYSLLKAIGTFAGSPITGAESLTVTLTQQEQPGPEVIDLNTVLPHLSHLFFGEHNTNQRMFRLSLTLIHAHLKTLHLFGLALNAQEGLSILAHLPSLQQLDLEFCTSQRAEGGITFTHIHPSIKIIGIHGNITAEAFLEGLTCPLLNRVSLASPRKGEHGATFTSGNVLASFMQRSETPMTLLFRGEWPHSLLHNVLLNDPNIRVLVAADMSFTSLMELPHLPPSLRTIECWERSTLAQMHKGLKHSFPALTEGGLTIDTPYCIDGRRLWQFSREGPE